MSLRADVYLESPEMVLGETLSAVREVAVDLEPQATADILLFTVRTPDDPVLFDELERAMAEDPTVRSFELTSEGESERVYFVEVDVDRRLMSEVAADLGINIVSSHSCFGESGWTFELEVPDRESLVTLRTFWEQREVPFDLRRLYVAPAGGGENFGLTELQRETLQVAAENGYFDVPRGISQGELAERLDASPAAVSQRLRRATARLVASTIGESLAEPQIEE